MKITLNSSKTFLFGRGIKFPRLFTFVSPDSDRKEEEYTVHTLLLEFFPPEGKQRISTRLFEGKEEEQPQGCLN